MLRGYTHWIVLLFCIALAGGVGYFYYQTTQLETTLAATELRADQTQTTLSTQLRDALDTVAQRETQLEDLEEELEETKDDLRDAERELEDFEDEYRDTINTVRDLNRLSQIDEELLQQYSRVSFLNENYIPRRLVEIDSKWVDATKDDEYFLADAWPFLEDLLQDAERDDIDLRVLSAYRSFDEQASIKGRYLQTYGEGANTFSADQGFSEHQLGTAVDFSTSDTAGTLETFGETEAYEWMLDNAYKHGFILSYPEGNEFYIFEPWHWRFVGEDLARDLRREKRGFYDVPQRELDTYRLEIFD
jgi:D-alanyl-D-alanine carboxypeptidase